MGRSVRGCRRVALRRRGGMGRSVYGRMTVRRGGRVGQGVAAVYAVMAAIVAQAQRGEQQEHGSDRHRQQKDQVLPLQKRLKMHNQVRPPLLANQYVCKQTRLYDTPLCTE